MTDDDNLLEDLEPLDANGVVGGQAIGRPDAQTADPGIGLSGSRDGYRASAGGASAEVSQSGGQWTVRASDGDRFETESSVDDPT